MTLGAIPQALYCNLMWHGECVAFLFSDFGCWVLSVFPRVFRVSNCKDVDEAAIIQPGVGLVHMPSSGSSCWSLIVL